jgi:N-acetylglucosamine-6-phosphate deacetylase
MSATVRFAATHLGLSSEEVLRMTSRYPIELIGDMRVASSVGAHAEFAHLDDDLDVREVVTA